MTNRRRKASGVESWSNRQSEKGQQCRGDRQTARARKAGDIEATGKPLRKKAGDVESWSNR